MPPLALPESANAAYALWSRLRPAQRLVIGLAALAAVGLVVALVSFSGGSTLQTLYSGLSAEDSAQVQAKLAGLGIRFEMGENGSSVKVTADKIDQARLALAAEGLPGTGTLGFEIFDRTQLGVTDFTENVNLRRALEGELARTVKGIREVAAARVHVVLPRERPFAKDDKQAKASVVVRLRAGAKLDAHNVQAIQQLVGSAVEGLKPEAVVVVDDHGSLLSRAGETAGAGAGLSGSELDEKRQFETELSDNVVALLEPLYGAGRVFSRVHADLDFSASEETAEIYDPEKKAIVSEQRAEERFPRGSTTGGVPGVASNVGVAGPGAAATASPTPPPASEPPAKLSETRNYEVSKTVRRVSNPRGRLRRLSVAVIVDSRGATPAPAATPSPAKGGKPASTAAATPTPTPARLPDPARIQSLVAAAVGIDTARGDQLEVEIMPFDLAPADAAQLPLPSTMEVAREAAHSYGRPAGIALAVLLGYLMFLKPLKREVLNALRAAAQPAQLAPAGADGVGAGAAATLAARAEDTVELGAGFLPSEVRESVVKSVGSDPAATARFLRAWLDKES